MNYVYLKGHGTENDFVLLPDHDGHVHGLLVPERVVALCDRRAGIGGDGVMRVIRTSHYRGPDAAELPPSHQAEWFMDYRNSDGSLSEMCGNGIRVFARHLVDAGLADPERPIPIATRSGIKRVRVRGDLITTELGHAQVLGETKVAIGDRSWAACHIDMGNPHAVAMVDALEDAGNLLEPPRHDPTVYPMGVNVEFVVRRGERHIAMRVHERGSGETRSCGTGAGAAMVATAVNEGVSNPPLADVTYRVDVPGGTLSVTWTPENQVLLTGPGIIVAQGVTGL